MRRNLLVLFCLSFVASQAWGAEPLKLTSAPHIDSRDERLRIAKDLNRRIPSIEFKELNLLYVAKTFAFSGITIGLVVPSTPTTVSMKMDEPKASEALDELVRHLPEYKWTMRDDGIVRIEPRSHENDLTMRHLLSVVPPFESSGLSASSTSRLLMSHAKAAGVNAATIPQYSSSATLRQIADETREDERIEVRTSEPRRIIDLMDAIAIADSPSYWIAFTSPRGRLIAEAEAAHTHKLPRRVPRGGE